MDAIKKLARKIAKKYLEIVLKLEMKSTYPVVNNKYKLVPGKVFYET